MKCKRAEYLIASMVSGTIEETEREKLNEHLISCSACRRAHETQMAIEAELKSSNAPIPDAAFARRISKMTADMTPRAPKLGIRGVLSLISPLPVLFITSAIAFAIVWAVFDGTFIDRVRGILASAATNLSSPTGIVISACLVIAALVITVWGVHRTVRDF